MNGTLHFAFDEGTWTPVPRTWPDPVEGRSASRWAKRTARRVVADSPDATREQGRWFADSLLHLATRTSGAAALWLCMPHLGGPFLPLQVLATEASGDLEDVVARDLRLEVSPGDLATPESTAEVTAVGLGAGRRGSFTTDDGEGGHQVGVVWVFRSGGTDVRISAVGVHQETFAQLEPFVQDFIDGITVT